MQAETLARVFSCQLSKIFRNIFFYRKPLVADFTSNIITCGFIVFMVWQTKTAIHNTGVLKTSALKNFAKFIEKDLCQRCFPEIFVNLSRKGIYRTLSGDYFGQMFLCFSYYIRRSTITITLRWNTCLFRIIHLVRTRNFPNYYLLHPDKHTFVCVSGGKKC